jgi:hypothetical protein
MEKTLRTTFCYTPPGLIRARVFEKRARRARAFFDLVRKGKQRADLTAFPQIIERFLLLSNFADRT